MLPALAALGTFEWLNRAGPVRHLRAVSPSGKYAAEVIYTRTSWVLTMGAVGTGEPHILIREPFWGVKHDPGQISWDPKERGILYISPDGVPGSRMAYAYELRLPPFAREVDPLRTRWAQALVEKAGLQGNEVDVVLDS
jgi:hypothetical protein